MKAACNISEDDLWDLLDAPQTSAALELREHARECPRCKERLASIEPLRAGLVDLGRDAAPPPAGSETLAAAKRRAAREDVPHHIGPYKVLDVLGEGGMGRVYLAEQKEPVKRRVALKVIRPGMDSSEVVARFEAERQALAMMSHSSIARVYDASTTPEGRPYFALEHVPGLALTAYCDKQRLGIPERLGLFMKVCHGVQHAHQKGVIHRDLKPGNILVQERDGLAEPKIIDFGVAKAVQTRLTERTLYTEQGRILGTPEYMSPEQAEMTALDVDTRSDIYSLGVLLYELLSGVLPFDSAELRKAGYYELQRKICEDEPPRPSTRLSTLGDDTRELLSRRGTTMRALSKALVGDLDWIVMKCLEKDPARRYQSASELAADLQRHLDDEPVEAGPPSARYRIQKLLKKRRGLVAAVTTTFLGLVFGLSLAIWQREEARANEERALKAEGDLTASLSQANTNLEIADERDRARVAALRTAQTFGLTGAAVSALDTDPVLALLLAREAVRKEQRPETLSHLQRALANLHQLGEMKHAGGEGLEYVFSAKFSPDADRIVTAHTDVHVWDLEGREVQTIRGHDDVVFYAVFSADGTRILSASRDGTARVWDANGNELLRLPHGDPVHHAAYSPDESLIVTGCEDGKARVWSAAGELLTVLHPAPGSGAAGADPTRTYRIYSAEFSPDGDRVLTSGADGTARIWDLSGKQLAVLKPPARNWSPRNGRPMHGAVYSPDGELVVGACWDGNLYFWTSEGELLQVAIGHTNRARRPTFSPNGNLVLSGSNDLTVRIWNRLGRELLRLRGHRNGVFSTDFSPDGRLFVTSAVETSACLWTMSPPGVPMVFEGMIFGAPEVTWQSRYFMQPDGSAVRVLGDGTLRTTDSKGNVSVEWHDSSESARWLAMDSSGERFLVTERDPDATWIVDRLGRKLVRLAESFAWWAGFSPTGDRVAVSFKFGRGPTQIYDTHDGNELFLLDLEPHPDAQTAGCGFSPSGDRIVAGSSGGASLFDANGDLLRSLSLPEPLREPLFSPDGQLILGFHNNVARLIDTEGRLVSVFEGHDGFVLDGKFSPDGKYIVTAGRDHTARIWDLAGNVVMVLKGHRGSVWRTTYFPSGRHVLTESEDGTARIWMTQPEDILRIADELAYRTFTEAERERYSELLDDAMTGR